MAKGTKGTKGDVTFFGEESNKEPVCDVKVKLIKLEGGTAVPPPVAGKTLRCLVWSKLRPVIPSLSPLVWLRQPWHPAALSAAPQTAVGRLVLSIAKRMKGNAVFYI